jgi:nitrite reductase (NADH) large subunit
MTSDPSYPFVIIGNGAAGVGAVEGIRRHNHTDRILIISKEVNKFYSKPGLAYWLIGEIPEKQLYPRSAFDDKQWGIERLHGQVTAIDPDRHTLSLEDGRNLQYQRLLIATGAQAIRPTMEGINLKGVVTLDSLEDTREILKLARKAKQAVVVGGGITALELAEGLAARRIETHYLLRKDRYWGNVLDEHESRLVEERLKDEGIHLHYRVELRKILAKRNRVAGVALSTGEMLPCDMVGVAIGIRPQTALVEGTLIHVERGILVDETFKTSVEGIYAAGDVAQVWDSKTQQYVLDSLWGVAREQGRVAGSNMAGMRKPYQRKVPFNVTRIGRITTTLIGCIGQPESDEDLVAIARGDSETWRSSGNAFAVKKESENNRVRLLIGDRTIQGALVMGDQTLSRPLQHLIAEQIDISSIRERLMDNSEELAELIQHFWSERERWDHA